MIIFFLIDIHSMQGWLATTRHGVTRKRSTNSDVAKISGIDQISAKFHKDGTPVIAVHLANIINVSIKLDTFSSKCKTAKIKPMFKKGIKTEAKYYRPISLLLVISKLIEKWIPAHLWIRHYSKSFHRYIFVPINRHDFKWCWKWKKYYRHDLFPPNSRIQMFFPWPLNIINLFDVSFLAKSIFLYH